MSPLDLWGGPGSGPAATHPHHPDPRLRGRTYVIPYARVWRGVVELASGGMRGWRLAAADEDRGVVEAEIPQPLFRTVDRVEIRVRLDENALTRVDVASASPRGGLPWGRHRRRIRRFLQALDRRLGAGPGSVVDPSASAPKGLPALLLLVLWSLLGAAPACTPPRQEPGEASQDERDPAAEANKFGRRYERSVVYVGTLGDSLFLVPWIFRTRTRPGAVDRKIQAWLARGGVWDRFMDEGWETPPSAVPWRILPRGPVRLVVGLDDALDVLIFQAEPRRLEVALGPLLAEWTGPRAQDFRVHEGALALGDRSLPGLVLDLSRAWAAGDPPPGPWGFLTSGDSLQLVWENQLPADTPDGGRYTVWGRVGFSDRRWEGLRLVWSQRRSFEPARRDIPAAWDLRDPGRSLRGNLLVEAVFLEAGEGEGPILPVEGLLQVRGTVSVDGRGYPVRGIFRHIQQ